MIKLNKARIAVVIGTNGKTKNKIERELGVDIEIDSKTGECEVKPNSESSQYDPLNVLKTERIIQAINRGFNPKKAMKLAKDNFELEIFNLQSILGKSKKRLKRMKGRVIGRNGEMRRAIERYAECFVSVFGKTIAIIAEYENLEIARKAINMLISGTPHHTVLRFLENRFKEKKKERFRELYKPEF
jgi:ribosomal RNA assembly protein